MPFPFFSFLSSHFPSVVPLFFFWVGGRLLFIATFCRFRISDFFSFLPIFSFNLLPITIFWSFYPFLLPLRLKSGGGGGQPAHTKLARRRRKNGGGRGGGRDGLSHGRRAGSIFFDFSFFGGGPSPNAQHLISHLMPPARSYYCWDRQRERERARRGLDCCCDFFFFHFHFFIFYSLFFLVLLADLFLPLYDIRYERQRRTSGTQEAGPGGRGDRWEL